MRRWVTKEGPGLRLGERRRLPAVFRPRSLEEALGAWRAENLLCPCARWGPGRGGQGGEGHSHTHPPAPQRAAGPRSRRAAVVGWEDEAGPSGSVSEGASDGPGRGREAVQPRLPLRVLPSLLHLKPREGKELGLRRGARWGSRGSHRLLSRPPLFRTLSPPGPRDAAHASAASQACPLVQGRRVSRPRRFDNSQAGHTHHSQACRAAVQQRKPRCAGNA